MKAYKNFTTDDFVSDDYFCQWVLQPTEDSNKEWISWLTEHPYMRGKVSRARKIVEELYHATSPDTKVNEDLIAATWEEIDKQTQSAQSRSLSINWKIITKIAAAVVLVLGFSLLMVVINKSNEDALFLVEQASVTWEDFENSSATVKRIELADGSVVTLEPESKLKFPLAFEGNNRPVVLEGEAFFEIAKDTVHPFYVYANAAVIRVLGTSFYVKARDTDKDVEVVVKTGKVAVYKRSEIEEFVKVEPKKIQPLLVTPNQKVVLDKAREQLTKRLTSTPQLVKPLGSLSKLKFDEEPVSEIFTALEEAYGVDIDFSDSIGPYCLLTTTLTEQTLFEKLDIICAPLGLLYEEIDARIVIQGSCK